MKPAIHPNYRTVVFHDTSADTYFTVGSTIATARTIERDGRPILMSHWISPQPHIRTTPVNKKSSPRKAVLRASISVLVAS